MGSVVSSSQETEACRRAKAAFAKYTVGDVRQAYLRACSQLAHMRTRRSESPAVRAMGTPTPSAAATPVVGPADAADGPPHSSMTASTPLLEALKNQSLIGINIGMAEFYSLFGPGSYLGMAKSFLSLPFDVFNLFDRGSSGKVVVLELFLVLSLYSTGDVKDRMSFCFDIFDDDGSGELDKEEMAELVTIAITVLWKLGDLPEVPHPEILKAVCDNIFEIADEDGSGAVDIEEFYTWAASSTHTTDMMKKFEKIEVEVKERKEAAKRERVTYASPSRAMHPFHFEVTSLVSPKRPRPVAGGEIRNFTTAEDLQRSFNLCADDLRRIAACLAAAEALPPSVLSKLSAKGQLHAGLQAVLACTWLQNQVGGEKADSGGPGGGGAGGPGRLDLSAALPDGGNLNVGTLDSIGSWHAASETDRYDSPLLEESVQAASTAVSGSGVTGPSAAGGPPALPSTTPAPTATATPTKSSPASRRKSRRRRRRSSSRSPSRDKPWAQPRRSPSRTESVDSEYTREEKALIKQAGAMLGVNPERAPVSRDAAPEAVAQARKSLHVLQSGGLDLGDDIDDDADAADAATKGTRTRRRPATATHRRVLKSRITPLNFTGTGLMSPVRTRDLGDPRLRSQAGSLPSSSPHRRPVSASATRSPASETGFGHGGRYRPLLQVMRGQVSARPHRITTTLAIAQAMHYDAQLASEMDTPVPQLASDGRTMRDTMLSAQAGSRRSRSPTSRSRGHMVRPATAPGRRSSPESRPWAQTKKGRRRAGSRGKKTGKKASGKKAARGAAPSPSTTPQAAAHTTQSGYGVRQRPQSAAVKGGNPLFSPVRKPMRSSPPPPSSSGGSPSGQTTDLAQLMRHHQYGRGHSWGASSGSRSVRTR